MVLLFKFQWAKLTAGGVTIDRYGMTIVDVAKTGSRDESFVLASEVAQVFYAKDMSSKSKRIKDSEPKRHIVYQGKEIW